MGKKEAVVHEFPKTKKSEVKLGSLQQKLETAKCELEQANIDYNLSLMKQKNAQLEYDRALASFRDATKSFLKEMGD
jgi:hypothetical protein